MDKYIPRLINHLFKNILKIGVAIHVVFVFLGHTTVSIRVWGPICTGGRRPGCLFLLKQNDTM